MAVIFNQKFEFSDDGQSGFSGYPDYNIALLSF